MSNPSTCQPERDLLLTLSSFTFTSDSLTFPVTTAGPSDGAPIVLLHGFPQDATSWTEVATKLADRGYRTYAPDLRGYAPTARPQERSDYSVARLASDVVTLVQSIGGPVHIAGHDWGGSLLWTLRQTHPELFSSVTIVSTPDPAALAWSMLRSDQALRSWYITAIGLPRLPEAFLTHYLAQFLVRSGLPADRATYYQERMRSDQGRANASLNWYRQMLVEQLWPRAAQRVAKSPNRRNHPLPPTTYVWGAHDSFLGKAAATRTAEVTRDLTFIQVSDGGHWLPETHPDEVSAAILDSVEAAS